ncbi:28 kDa heat- and acid-stable phosphoprotein-like [Drosophila sulfurigaster albostrigata]|uniref:28 kDa heat- and acid-stable phosphoprotein-like n=1 Tax=Drosophila sulfurigaster albostrigata TaxID=89887 RepID=UPI002D219000|nr:28 kDa heat- and acid-stable phosphoprotein-like [Drosophila sulfurigaster albostrigata]XP_062139306.1 28 kDa heat- and acid-stable phosphoprotein-like [Drosophila sulfurigaster albostrigata]XP_062139307.1 28 kDa heat- and acid-stable phosphoprotein-like [Drosophila sulfurigaster albostrigata]
MPRGKFLNHKGRSRQFTPIEELLREQELEVNLDVKSEGNGNRVQRQSDNDNNDNVFNQFNNTNADIQRIKKVGGPVEGLIVISNPNRPHKSKSVNDLLLVEDCNKRCIEKGRGTDIQKTVSEVRADLARLALVRKNREAAAEIRLAAKRDNNPKPLVAPIITVSKSFKSNSKSTPSSPSKGDDIVTKKKKNRKSALGANQFLKSDDDSYYNNTSNENIRKIMKVRNGNKRNVRMHI